MQETPQFKYNINSYLSSMPSSISIGHVEKVLELHYGIDPVQFSADRNIAIGSDEEIPIIRLVIYARVLAIPIQQLLQINKAA